METLNFKVEKQDIRKRLDVFLTEKAQNRGLSRAYIKRLCDDGAVTVNAKNQRAGYPLREYEVVQLQLPAPKNLEVTAQNIPLKIVFEDDFLAVINKPAGMVVHPAAGNEDGTLVNALLYNLKSLSTINGVIRPGIVHRLDKDTSGLLVVAKTDDAHRALSTAIAKKEAKRFYYALVDGNITDDNFSVSAPIGRSSRDRKKMAVVTDGRAAQTLFTVVERFGRYTLLECELKTGRTHQIRVHCQYIHHPVVADATYGGSNEFKQKGQLLHAYKLQFSHPVSGQSMTFTSPLPQNFQQVLDKLRKHL